MRQARWRRVGSRKTCKEQEEVLSYLEGGHESFNCVVMEVIAYMVSWQPPTPRSPQPVPYSPRLHD